MPRTEKRLLRAVVNYSRFNAERTLGVASDSEFSATKFGAAIALADPARPRLPMFNRVLGLGLDDAGQIDTILGHYKAAGCEPHFDLGNDAIVPELISKLVGGGFEPTDAVQYLSSTPGSQVLKSPPAEISIARWENDHADRFRELLATSGVTCDDAIWERRRPLYCTDSFRVYVAMIGDEPCAWATLFADDESRCGYLANAFTMPSHRGRGCHGALLAARLADARALGLKTAHTDVIPDTPSARNCRRVGFKPAATLTLWRR